MHNIQCLLRSVYDKETNFIINVKKYKKKFREINIFAISI